MKQLGYVRRKMVKCKTMAHVSFRNEQFEYIKRTVNDFIFNGLPVLSLDTKKKELIGNFYRDWHLLTHEQIDVFDHDLRVLLWVQLFLMEFMICIRIFATLLLYSVWQKTIIIHIINQIQ